MGEEDNGEEDDDDDGEGLAVAPPDAVVSGGGAADKRRRWSMQCVPKFIPSYFIRRCGRFAALVGNHSCDHRVVSFSSCLFNWLWLVVVCWKLFPPGELENSGFLYGISIRIRTLLVGTGFFFKSTKRAGFRNGSYHIEICEKSGKKWSGSGILLGTLLLEEVRQNL